MELGKAALEYAALGYSIIPLRPNDKKALVQWTDFQSFIAGEEQINAWWSQYPSANIGIITGAVSGSLMVVDLDLCDGHENPYPGDLGAFPETAPVAITGRGGRHVYMRIPDGVTIRNSAGRLAPHVDVRGEGGYLVAPPSVHASGTAYVWGVPLDCPPKELPEAPDWLLKAIEQTEKRSAKGAAPAETDWAATLQGVSKGRRNQAAAELAGRMLGRGLERGEVEIFLTDWNAKNTPPLPEKELSRVIDSIARRELMGTAVEDVPSRMAITDEQREHWLKEVSGTFKIPLAGVTFYDGDEPYYEIDVEGRKAWIAGSEMASAYIVKRKLTSVARKVARIPTGKGGASKYMECMDMLMAAARPSGDTDDATMEAQLRMWLEKYLYTRVIYENGELDNFQNTISEKGYTYIYGSAFLLFVRLAYNARIEPRDWAQILVRYGFAPCRILLTLKSGMTRRIRMYRVPPAMLDNASQDTVE